MKFYYDKNLKYTNRQIVSNLEGLSYAEKEYVNIDSADTINGHIIYQLNVGEEIPTYIFDEENNRRWYVSGITQLRTGKFQISLIRDIISEGNLEWKNEQAYISAGTASNYNKYKTWGLPFTNTKISEQPLTINGQPSYFVFYTNTQTISNTGAITESDLKLSSTLVPSGTQVDVELDELSDYKHYSLLNKSIIQNRMQITVGYRSLGDSSDYRMVLSNPNDSFLLDKLGSPPFNTTAIVVNDILEGGLRRLFENRKSEFLDITKELRQKVIESYFSSSTLVDSSLFSDLSNDVNKVFLDKSTSKIYKLSQKDSQSVLTGGWIVKDAPMMQSYISALNNIQQNLVVGISSADRRDFITQWKNEGAGDVTKIFYFEELEDVQNFSFNFSADVLKLPKSAVRCVNISSAGSGIEDAELGQALMQMSANTANLNNDTGQIIDIQYLPFSVATQVNENINVNNKSLVAQFLNLDDYYFSIQNEALTDINKETDSIKLVSPSRATQFVFSPYNNDGNLNIDFKATIRPFATVMYLRPHTTGLLLYDFDDKNCLIVDEDFSLTLLSSEWSNYVRQNRNYNNTFNREIQGREVERTWERRVEQAQAKSDEWTARNISAQKAQAYTGNLPIISSIAGAIGTAWKDSAYMEAAQLDREYNEAMYQESLSLARDMFNYQLDNIKSQPTMPSKITTIDCKFMGYFILEYWSTNITEKAAITSYYSYNGNRIDDYGTFNDYWGNFVRGKIIIAKNYTQPELNELNRRLQAGIFTGGNA